MPRSRSRRVAAMAAVVVLAASGCIAGTDEGGSDQRTGDVTVEFWTINLEKDYGDYVRGLISDFEAEHSDITIDWVDVPGADVESKLLSALATDDVPDAVNIEDYRIDQFADGLADLNEHFDKADLDIYMDGLLRSVRRDDKLTAIPWYNGGAPVAAYDKTALKAAGIEEDSLPTTWPEAFELGEDIVDATDRCAFNALPTIGVMLAEDVSLLSKDRKRATLDNDQAAAVLESFRDAYDDGVICQGAVSENERNLPENLTNGQAAAAVNELPFALLDVEKNAPKVYEQLTVTPTVTGKAGKVVIPGMQTLVVPKKSDVQTQAAEFIKWVTSAANQLAFCKQVTIFPSTAETLDDPHFSDIDTSKPADAARAAVVSELPDVITADLGTAVDVKLDDAYLERIRAFMTGDATAKQTLTDIADEWDALLNGD